MSNTEVTICVKRIHFKWHTCKLCFITSCIYTKNAQQVLKNAKISPLARLSFSILDIIFLIQDTKVNLILKNRLL